MDDSGSDAADAGVGDMKLPKVNGRYYEFDSCLRLLDARRSNFFS